MARNRKNDIKFHEEMKQASIAVYGKKGASMPEGYVRKGEPVENKSNGFYAEVWQKGNDIVIVYRGTDEFIDGKNDLSMAHSIPPNQTIDALALHDKIKRENKNFDISVTGHSLGGSLAQIVSSVRGTFATTFNAYGTRNMFYENEKLKSDNIVNYINEYDPIAMINAENHVGDNYTVSNDTKTFWGNHFAENLQSLESRIPQTTEELKKTTQHLHRTWLNLRNAKRNIENTRNTIAGKTFDTLQSVANGIQKGKQNIAGGIKNVSKNLKQCVGLYQVSGYTREDGTDVKGHTRTCGAKHTK